MNENEAKALYSEFMAAQEHAQTLENHRTALTNQLKSIEETQAVIDALENLHEDTAAWIPIAPGAYAKATLHKNAPILLNVGAGTAVEKQPADVRTTLSEHHATLQELHEGATEELQTIVTQLDAIRSRVERAQPKS